MKHKFLLSTLTAIIVFAVATTAEAGIFGRLSTVWNGCNPCEQVACTPCEPLACQPCEPACDPCEVVCSDYGYRPFRPFGGFLANVRARLTAATQCGTDCTPCEAAACTPCEAACTPCDAACDPCEPVCGDLGRPFRPLRGFFANLGSRLTPSDCSPCDAICSPCDGCQW